MRARVTVTVLLTGLGFAALVLIVSEAGMQVEPGDRLLLYGVFAASVVLAGAIGWCLTRLHRRLPSLRWTILVVAVAAVAVTGGVVAASAGAMFLAPADLRVVLAALFLGTGLGVIVAVGVTGPLTADLRSLADAARRVAEGDLSVRTQVDRGDEVGELAASVDLMVDQLARLEDQRGRGEAARQHLLTAIGHDLRTPLASMQAAIEAIEDGVAPDPDRYLRSMRGDIDRLRGMVEDLFVLSRLEAGEQPLDTMPVDLVEVAEGAVEAVAPLAARHDVEVRLTADAADPITGDPQALDRVLRNLLDNAIRYAPAASTIDVSVHAHNGMTTVRVHDDGPGFPAEFVAQAFEQFSRADPARERPGGGAGLGLAISRELITAHGGQIWIEPSAGAELAFSIPVRDPLGGGAIRAEDG